MKAINAKGFSGITTGQVDKLTEIAVTHGAKGLAYIQVRGEDPVHLALPHHQVLQRGRTGRPQGPPSNIEEGDLDPLCGRQVAKAPATSLAGFVSRSPPCRTCWMGKDDILDFLWVTEFPLLVSYERGRRAMECA